MPESDRAPSTGDEADISGDESFPSRFTEDRCEICLDLEIFFLTQEMRHLRASAAAGCSSCDLLRSAIESYLPEMDDEAQFTAVKSISMLEIIYPYKGQNQTRLALYGAPTKGRPSVWAASEPEGGLNDNKYRAFHPLHISELPDISRDTASVKARELAQSWISECNLQHDLCPSLVVHKLPGRVLDLQGPDGTNDIRLYQSDGDEAPYISLSHCWGTSHVLCLTEDNLEAFQTRIPWKLLPRTFQEAITFTRDLGIRYLWIDSLCIIQDSAEDWDSEALAMSTVYGNSYLTIAACKGSGAADGLFAVTESDYDLHRLDFTLTDGHPIDAYVRRKIPHLDAQQGFPLLSRAWVFQERLLSPRVLYFGPQELIWECMEDRKCECSFINTSIMSERTPDSKQDYRYLFRKGSDDGNGTLMWKKIVKEYSRLKLTKASDIFAALAGLAQVTGRLVDAPYGAGLWSDSSLPEYLLWHSWSRIPIAGVEPPEPLLPRPVLFRAPTWSWASISTSIEFPNYDIFMPECQDAGVSNNIANDFTVRLDGKIGLVRLTAPLRAVTLKSQDLDKTSPRSRYREIELYIDGQEISRINCSLDYDIWCEESEPFFVPDGSTLHCLQLGRSWKYRDMERVGDSNEHELEFSKAVTYYLILRKVTEVDDLEGIEGVYDRIGYAELPPLGESTPKPESLAAFQEGFRSVQIVIF